MKQLTTLATPEASHPTNQFTQQLKKPGGPHAFTVTAVDADWLGVQPRSTFALYEQQLTEELSKRMGTDSATACRHVDDFAELMGVHYGVPFNATTSWVEINGDLRRVSGWSRRKKGGRDTRLHRVHLIDHLLGKVAIAPKRDPLSQWAIIDIDVHHERDHEDLLSRLGSVQAALNHAPCILIRSSRSFGLHLHYRLDTAHPAGALHDSIVEALRRHHVDVRPGRVEVFPAGDRFLRLPLGAGSCILDPDTYEPQAARYTSNRTMLYRDHGPSLLLFQQLAKERVVTLDQLIQTTSVPPTVAAATTPTVLHIYGGKYGGGAEPLPRSSVGASVGPSGPLTLQSTQQPRPRNRIPPGGGTTTTPSMGTGDYFARLEACRAGVSGEGMRNKEALLIVWDLVRRRRLGPKDAMREFTTWLDTGKHASKDLTLRGEATRKAMLRGAEKNIARLLSTVRGVTGQGEGHRSFTTFLQYMCNTEGDGWREVARAAVTDADRHLLSEVRSDWVRTKLEVVVGTIRYGVAKFGMPTVIAMPRTALIRVAGGRPPPPGALADRRSCDQDADELLWAGKKEVRSAYGVLLSAAQRLGLVVRRPGGHAIRGRRATQFDLWLP